MDEASLNPSTTVTLPKLPTESSSPSKKKNMSSDQLLSARDLHPKGRGGPTQPRRIDGEDGQGAARSNNNKPTRRRRHRNRNRRNRRQSFLTAEDDDRRPNALLTEGTRADDERPEEQNGRSKTAPAAFYGLGQDLSSSSLESEALLDHRDQPMMRPRKDSRLAQSFRPGSLSISFRPSEQRIRSGGRSRHAGHTDSDDSEDVDDRTPLVRRESLSPQKPAYGRCGTEGMSPFSSRQRLPSGDASSSRSPHGGHRSPSFPSQDRDYNVNNPPSIPSTPKLGPDIGYDDAVVTGADFILSAPTKSSEQRRESFPFSHDMVIDVDGVDRSTPSPRLSPSSPQLPGRDGVRRRRTVTLPAEEDVCFPTEEASEIAEEDGPRLAREEELGDRRRRRRREWPDLSVLEEWSRVEKEERHGVFRVKKINEPVLVEGRLRPQYRLWRREEDDAPYRFTYFNEEFQSTIHAQTISELVQPGGTFRELFIPDPPELDDSSDDEDVMVTSNPTAQTHAHHAEEGNYLNNMNNVNPVHGASNESKPASTSNNPNINKPLPRALSIISEAVSESRTSPSPNRTSGSPNPSPQPPKPKRYGPRPTFWLDVLCPTDAEMRVISKAFGIHALTAEDIMMQEAREKVELFRNYYFVNYRTFEQDRNSENYLEPVNMYVVVFRDGVLSFHFSQTPHPANVRRRIRQLMDYLILSSDWISYALIDDITDVFGPLIQSIENEVDEIDDVIMQMHSLERGKEDSNQNASVAEAMAPGEMLRRVGECRKKVMGMYRLLSTKADVVKGFAKRCNEQWEVAPKSEIGLYLGDIQDHIMTMTSNLTHYETILSRAHSNYLAQINILMNERQEQTADVLGKLTVLGTIVLPMNIICGMWGMNVKVPGQEVDNLWWFWSIAAGLLVFAVISFYVAKRVYKIV